MFNEAKIERIVPIADITTETTAVAQAGLSYIKMEQFRALRDAARNKGG